MIGAGSAFSQKKVSSTSVGGMAAPGVREKTKLCAAPLEMLAGVLGVPVA
jgi:hypothetical protein